MSRTTITQINAARAEWTTARWSTDSLKKLDAGDRLSNVLGDIKREIDELEDANDNLSDIVKHLRHKIALDAEELISRIGIPFLHQFTLMEKKIELFDALATVVTDAIEFLEAAPRDCLGANRELDAGYYYRDEMIYHFKVALFRLSEFEKKHNIRKE